MLVVDEDLERVSVDSVTNVGDEVVDGFVSACENACEIVEVAEAEVADRDVFVACGEDGVTGDGGGTVSARRNDDVVFMKNFRYFSDIFLEDLGRNFVFDEVAVREE